MAEVGEIWTQALPLVREGVTGVGVWAALNAAVPLAIEDGVFVLGMPAASGDLAGHLKLPQTKRLMDQTISGVASNPLVVRIILGTAPEDWEATKRKDIESQRLQQQSMTKMRAEMAAKTSWEGIYEQLSRRYAAMSAKSLPQNRARFLEEVIELIAETRRSQESWDENGERSFARCLERVAQYTEIPSAIVARLVLERAGEL